ncbi:hypothetical protein TNCV_3553051 [Trichonephila clavipes]|nr:hypothetical protein TNCV_3553051 [Trichonephila clavipes]
MDHSCQKKTVQAGVGKIMGETHNWSSCLDTIPVTCAIMLKKKPRLKSYNYFRIFRRRESTSYNTSGLTQLWTALADTRRAIPLVHHVAAVIKAR